MTDNSKTPAIAKGATLNRILASMRLAIQLVKAGEGEAAVRMTNRSAALLAEALSRTPGNEKDTSKP